MIEATNLLIAILSVLCLALVLQIAVTVHLMIAGRRAQREFDAYFNARRSVRERSRP